MQINLNSENPFDKARQAFKKAAPPAKSYAEHKANFEKSALGKEVSKAFTPLPYEQENRGLYRTAGFVSYACQIVSVSAAASFVFAFILCRINTLPGAWYVAFVIAAAALFVIEFLLRKETPKLSRTILLSGFSSNIWRRGMFVLILTAAGIMSSYLGGFDTAAAVAENPPVYFAPSPLSTALINTGQIEERYAAQIADAKAAAAEYKTRRLWKNRLSIADGNKYRKLLAVATNKEADLNAEIQVATASNATQRENTSVKNSKRESAAKLAHNEAVSIYENRINNNGGGLARLSVFAQLIFFCCLVYRSHYLIETAKQYTSPTTDDDFDGDLRTKKDSFSKDNFDDILSERKESKGAILNRAKMRVLPRSKSAQIDLTIDTTATKQSDTQSTQTVFVPTDLSIEHTDRQTGKLKRLNISQVRANISANKTRLRRAKESGTDKQIDNIEVILCYWWEREEELIKAAALVQAAAAG